jgi:hypothetical protein
MGRSTGERGVQAGWLVVLDLERDGGGSNDIASDGGSSGGGQDPVDDVYARFYSGRQCWASKCRCL